MYGGGSAFLRKGVLFVYFCKTGSLLGYEIEGKCTLDIRTN